MSVYLKLKLRQYPAIHTNYMLHHRTTLQDTCFHMINIVDKDYLLSSPPRSCVVMSPRYPLSSLALIHSLCHIWVHSFKSLIYHLLGQPLLPSTVPCSSSCSLSALTIYAEKVLSFFSFSKVEGPNNLELC